MSEIYIIKQQSKINKKFYNKLFISYISFLLFLLLFTVISLSIHNFISRTPIKIKTIKQSDYEKHQAVKLNAHKKEQLEKFAHNDLDDVSSFEEEKLNTVTVTVNKGDSLYSVLKSIQIEHDDVIKIIKAAKQVKLANRLMPNHKFTFYFETVLKEENDLNKEEKILNLIVYELDKTKKIEISRQENGSYKAKESVIPFKKSLIINTQKIDSSFLAAVKKTGISNNNLIEVVNAYSHRVDFQRNIKKGDKITLIYEKFYNSNNEFSHYGNVVFSSLNLQGRKLNIYRYNYKDLSDFYDEKGNSVKSTLLKTPVNYVRISSHFGRRKHPVLGYTKMHKGVDFAAPTGTPIYAAGDGIVEEIGWKGGYGRYVRIRHNGHIKTAYGHASRFAKNVKKGTRVKQGQIIAFVGKSGRATGPHLHFELIKKGMHVNPLKVKSAPGFMLKGNDYKKFAEHKKYIDGLKDKLKVASELPAAKLNLAFNKQLKAMNVVY